MTVEELEGRAVPATITWNTGVSPSGGDFSTGSNWVGGVAPGAADDAVINLTSAGVVGYNSAASLTVGSITTNANATLNVNKGTLAIAASPSAGTFGAAVNVAGGATLAANAGAKVQFTETSVVTVTGTLAANGPALFSANRTSFPNRGTALNVAGGGLLQLTNANLTQTGTPGAPAAITVGSNAGFKSTGSTVGWDQIAFDANSVLAVGDVTTTAFDAAVTTPVRYVPAFVGNARFKDVTITGTTSQPSLTLAPLGVDASNQRYVFPAGPFTVAAGTALNFAAGTKLFFTANSAVAVSGTLSVDSPASVVANRTSFPNYGVALAVGSGGLLKLNNANFGVSGVVGGTAQITVGSGGGFQAANSTVGWDGVTFDPTSLLSAGDITGTAFMTALTTPAKYVPVLVGNASFQDVILTTGTNDPTLTLAPLGVDASNQRYVFAPNATFTVAAGTALNFTAGTKLLFAAGSAVAVNGTLGIDSPAGVVGARTVFPNAGVTVTVGNGGLFRATNATFTSTGPVGILTLIQVGAGGGFKLDNSTMSWDAVNLDAASVLAVGDIVTTAFDATITVPVKYAPVLVGNKRFLDVGLIGTTQQPSLDLGPLGVDHSNQRYVFAGGPFTVAAGTALNFTPGTNLLFGTTGVSTINVNGTLSIDTPVSVVASRGVFPTRGVTVAVGGGGTFRSTNAVYTVTGGGSTADVQVNGGGLVTGTGNSYGWDSMTLAGGATAKLQYNFWSNSTLNISSGTNVPLNAVRNNDFSGAKVVASGASTATIDLTNNYWGSSVVSVINGLITDHLDNAALPTVNYTPFLTSRPVQTVVVAPAAIAYGLTDQTVSLSATLRSPSGTGLTGVNGGTVSFRILDGLGATVGSATVGNVSAGAAAVSYTIPGGTAAGVYTIQAQFSGSGAFGPSTDGSQTLTINPAPTVTTAHDATRVFSVAAGTVTLVADVTSGIGTVGQGAVVFRVFNAANALVGSAVSQAVFGGTATASYALPANTPTGTYTVQAAYGGTPSLAASADGTRTLTVTPAGTTTVATGATAVFSGLDQNVTLTAHVTSPAGLVNDGAVTFTVKNGATVVGVASGAVVNGVATSTPAFVLPANTPAGVLTIDAAFGSPINYSPSGDATQTLTVNKAAQTITFTPPSPKSFAPGLTILLGATGGGSGNPVAYTVVSGPGTVAGNVLTVTGAGSIVVQADQAGSANYTGAAAVQQTVTVNRATQVITFTAPAPATYDPAGLTIPLTATGGGSANAVAFTVVSGPGTVAGNVLTVTGAGSIVVQADQAGDANYADAASVQQTVIINKVAQAIAFTPPAPATFAPGLTIPLTATGGGSGNAVTFTVVSGPGTVAGGVLTVTGAGAIVVQADQTGDANYAAAPPVRQTVTVNKAAQAIAFTPPAAVTFAPGLTIPLTATSTSGLAVAFSVVSGPGTVVGNVLTVTGAGAIVVQADQVGDANYSAATSVRQTVTVNKAAQTVTFTPPAGIAFTAAPQALTATSSSGLPVSYRVVSGPATVAGNLLTLTGVGNVVVEAGQPGDGDYLAATGVERTIAVAPGPQTIAFAPPAAVTFAPGLTVPLAATGGGSGNAVTYTVVSGPGAIAGNVLTVTGAGGIVIQADQAGTANYTAAAPVQRTVVVNKAAQAITFHPQASATYAPGLTIPLAAVGGGSGNPVTFVVVSGPGSVSGGVLTVTGAGTVVVEADQAGNANYIAAAAVQQTILVNPAPGTLLGVPQITVGSGDSSAVNFYNPDGTVRASLTPFPGFTGGVRTATGDFNRDGVPDIVVGTGPGSATNVRVLDGKTQAELFVVDPFEPTFTGGVYVAVGDLNRDGVPELIVTPDEGGGPRVRVFDGAGVAANAQALVADFFGIDDPDFRGGARAAVGDLSGDGAGDLVVVAGFGGGPRVAAFDGGSLAGTPRHLFGDFFAFEQSLRNGVFVAVGDVNGDGYADLVAGGGPGGGPRVLVFDGRSLLSNAAVPLANFFGGDPNSRGGIRVAVKDLDGDSRADLVVGSGAGAGSHVTAYYGKDISLAGTPAVAFEFDAFGSPNGGVYVG